MPNVRFQRVRRRAVRVAAGVVLLAALALGAFLPFAGRYLVAEDPLERADVIFVLAGARVERWLEAVDLYREGWASRILLSAGWDEPAEIRLRELGVRYPSGVDLARDAIVQLGIPAGAIHVLPLPVDNTAEEAAALRDLIATTRWQRVIVVTSRYHTRRSRFAFTREFRGTPVETRIRATRYDEVTPERWWVRRQEFRFVTSELQKLVAYRLGLAD